MKNIKCLLGHKLFMMKLRDIEKAKYENEEENITIYKCKHCGKVIYTKTNFVNTKVNEKPEIEKEPKIETRVVEYYGWSLNNLGHYLSQSTDMVMHLVSDKKINETERFGLVRFLVEKIDIYKGIDICVEVFVSKYDEKDDCIKVCYPSTNDWTEVAGAIRFPHWTENAKSKFLYYSFELDEKCTIITLKYTILNKRYDKSWWWRIRNKRICKVISHI